MLSKYCIKFIFSSLNLMTYGKKILTYIKYCDLMIKKIFTYGFDKLCLE